MTDTLNPLNPQFPVPLEGGIPSFWKVAAEWRGRSPQLWDAETRRAARWANGPIPEGYEPRWTVFMPAVGDWPPALPPASNRPATVYVAPPPPPRLAIDAPAGVTHETAALPATAPEPNHPQWPPPDDGDLLGFKAIWDEPERRPILGRRRRRGAHQ